MTPDETRVLTTERLGLDRFTLDDATFALELLNEPAFLRFIGDKRVRTLDDARAYLENGPLASYRRNGHGLLCVRLLESRAPIGMCGLLRRDAVPDPDIGFAFLPAYQGRGYALEASQAVLDHGRGALNFSRIVAYTAVDNERSIRLLERLGLAFEGLVSMPGTDDENRRFAVEF